jgi:hypothetical protein
VNRRRVSGLVAAGLAGVLAVGGVSWSIAEWSHRPDRPATGTYPGHRGPGMMSGYDDERTGPGMMGRYDGDEGTGPGMMGGTGRPGMMRGYDGSGYGGSGYGG